MDDLQKALLVAGQLYGLAMTLDVETLETFLDSKPKGFNWEPTCRETIKFRRALDSLFIKAKTETEALRGS